MLEADLLRFYRVDLVDLVTGRLSWRRLQSLVAGLPPDAATVRAVAGESAAWGLTEHLLAAVVDTLAAANWQRAGGKGHRPKRIPRPGVTPDGTRHGRTTRPRADVVAYLDQYRPEGR